MVSALLLVTTSPMAMDAEEAFAKYKAWRETFTTFRSEQRFREAGQPWGESTVTVLDGKVRLTATVSGKRYELQIMDGEVLEVDGFLEVYDRFQLRKGALFYESRVSDLASAAYPLELLQKDWRTLAPPDTKWTAEQGDGSVTIKARITGMATGNVEIGLKDSGEPFRYYADIRSQGGRFYREFEFKAVQPNPKVEANLFALREPDDYSPFGLPELPPRVEVGLKMDFRDWLAGGKPLDLGGKPTLLYAVLPNDAHKGLLDSMLQTLRLPRKRLGAPDDARADVQAKNADVWRLLMQGGSPVILLVDSKNVLAGAWLGLSPKIANERRTEIAAAIEALGKKN
jgi:hypothetical protein